MIQKFIEIWKKFLMLINKFTILVTFFGIVAAVLNIIKSYFFLDDYIQAIVGCIVLITLIHANLKIQGGE